MNKNLRTFIFVIVGMLLVFIGVYFYTFFKDENWVKGKIQEKLESKLGIPVQIEKFDLNAGSGNVAIRLDKQALLETTAQYNLLDQTYQGEFTFNANNLKYKELLLAQIHGVGDFKGVSDDFVFTGNLDGLGDKIAFHYDGKALKLDSTGIGVEQLLALRELPAYVTGKIVAQVDMQNVKASQGTFSLHSNSLRTQGGILKAFIGKRIDLNIQADIKGTTEKNKVHLSAQINTEIVNIVLRDTHIDTKNNSIESDYVLDILDLQKMENITGKKLYGGVYLQGHISMRDLLKVDGKTQSLGGELSYVLVENTFDAKVNSIPLENILTTLGHKPLARGYANGNMQYNTKTNIGFADIDIKSFKIKPSKNTKIIKSIIGRDPAEIIYDSTKLHAKMQNNITNYTLQARGPYSTFEISDGKIDKIANTHHAKLKLTYEKYVLEGEIKGSAKKPKVVFNNAAFMESEAGKKIQKKIDDVLGEDAGEVIGNILKGWKF